MFDSPPPRSRPPHARQGRAESDLDGPNWVFLTVNTEESECRGWPQTDVHQALHQIWQDQATAWLVSDYVLIATDHLHLFCAPGICSLLSNDGWLFGRTRFAKTLPGHGPFQSGGFHHRLRDGESYSQKWQYAMENPVRKGSVRRPDEWPFKGRVHDICW